MSIPEKKAFVKELRTMVQIRYEDPLKVYEPISKIGQEGQAQYIGQYRNLQEKKLL